MAVIVVYPNVTSGDFELGFYNGTAVSSTNIFTGSGNSSKPQFFARLGNSLIFEATDTTGREFWITNGTAAGTHQIANIGPGASSSTSDDGSPVNSAILVKDNTPAVLNGLAFFAANDGSHGIEPWVTDGTGGNTHIVKDINTNGTAGSGAHGFVTFGNFVYFIANDGTHAQIWKTDGTTTTKVTNLPGGATASPQPGMTVSGNKLFFVYYDGNSAQQLYVLDGTATGAHVVPINQPPDMATVPANAAVANMTDVNGTLYFTMQDTVHGNELWKSDGNTATFIANIGTPDIQNIVITSGQPSDFVAFNGKVYFFANSDHGTELYKTDGTANGTVRVTDINSNTGQLSGYSIFAPQQLVVFENNLYFKAYNGSDHELYRLDTSDVAHKIDINNTGGAATASSSPFALFVAGGNLYFAATGTNETSPGLFKWDGTSFVEVAHDYTNAAGFGGVSYEWFNVIVTGSTPNDFNANGTSDILWQNDNGQTAIWLMSGATPVVQSGVGSNPGPTWHEKAAADFNNDGIFDILWQNDNGQAATWLMSGISVAAEGLAGGNPGPTWHVKGAGDFNADGNADILWQNDNGQAAIWLMNGGTPIAQSAVGANPGPTWHVKEAGDFNSDGKADILWQNDNGQTAIWLMNGLTSIVEIGVAANPGADWHVI